ncbi:hypothetical protein ACM66B_002553 [Microbotryomycetes sp. NB124-2]
MLRPRPPGRPSGSSSLCVDGDGDKLLSVDALVRHQQAAAATPARSSANRLNHKLSSSSLSISLPPDSPPVMFDELPDVYDHEQRLMQQTQRARTSCDDDNTAQQGDADVNSLSSQRSFNSTSSSTSSWTPWQPTHVAGQCTPPRKRGPSSRLPHRDVGVDGEQDSRPPCSSTFQYKSRHELEAMLANADKLIKDKERELSMLTAAGEGLLQEYTSLRHRHDHLLSKDAAASSARPSLSHSPSKSSDLSVQSHASGSSEELRAYPNPSPARKPRLPVGPSYGSPLSARSSSPSPGSSTFNIRQSTQQSTPSSSSQHRHSTSSGSGAPLTALRGGNASPHDVQSLSQANYQLTVQLSEIEADSERAERQGRKRLRKLERELASLKHELERVEERNTLLEEAVATTNALGSSTDSRSFLPIGGDDGEQTPTLFNSSFEDKQLGETSSVATFAPQPILSSNTGVQISAPGTPTVASSTRRRPGNGTPQVLVASPSPRRSQSTHLSEARESSSRKSPMSDEIVSQLLAKIEELKEANEIIADEKLEMSRRLDQATRDVDEFKRRCEEMEDALVIGWEDRRGTIEWPEQENDGSPVQARPKGNQRDIQRRSSHRRSGSLRLSSSLRSINSIASSTRSVRHSISPVSRRTSHPQRPSQPPRTLSSELGSELRQASFEREPIELFDRNSYDDEEEEVDYQGENGRCDFEGRDRRYESGEDEEYEAQPSSSTATNSTSTPTKVHRRHSQRASRRSHHQRRFSDLPSNIESFVTGSIYADLDTAQDVLPVGSLRHTGPPDAETYEKLTSVVGDLPAVWEDEDDFAIVGTSLVGKGKSRHSRRTSGVKGLRSGWVPRSVLQTLEWKETEEDDSEAYWSRYPDEEEQEGADDSRRIESREMVDERDRQERRERRRERRRRERRSDKGKRRAYDQEGFDALREEVQEEADTPLSRREHALKRLGLDTLPDFRSRFDHDAAYGRPSSFRAFSDDEDDSRGVYDSDISGSDYTRSYDEGEYDSQDDDDDETCSSFSHLSDSAVTSARQRGSHDNTFYPLTLRARYAPKMVVARMTDSAVKHLFLLVTYVRFFVVLGMALSWALWQGPKKMGMGVRTSARRRLQ